MLPVRPVAVPLLVLALGCGGGRGGEQPSAPDATITERVVEYFQKTVPTPGLTFKVTKLEPSEVSGWRRGNLEVRLGEESQSVTFYVSPDGRFLFRGEAVDLSVDPFEQVMRKIALEGQPVRGAPDSKVTIVEYSDFQCPFCARVYTTVENDVLKAYGDKVKFVFKNFPLTSIHPWAEDAALASECAFQQGNDAFWKMYDGLFSRQAEITKENLKEKAAEIAKAGGMDPDKLTRCLEERSALAAVQADAAEATALGVNSTPTFFVNGRRLAGAQTPEQFKEAIEQELAGG